MTKRSHRRPASGTPQPRVRSWWIGLGAAFLVLLLTALWFRSQRQDEIAVAPTGDLAASIEPNSRPVAQQVSFEIPEINPTSFRNASKSVAYVGSDACVECHRDDHASYLQTTHSRSLGNVDVASEPPDGEYRHELSGRSYRVYRQGDALRLREFIIDPSGNEVMLGDHVAHYSLGSGNYARMYLVKFADFLIEVPITWYPRRNSWGMSAGYEKNPQQAGFSREIHSHCLYCHAGRVESIAGVDQRLSIKEMAIGCERCHGPGELHVKERQLEQSQGATATRIGAIDDSIVNLRHLSRERQEDVCSQCHLSASADVTVRGRDKTDFRPGMKMADFVVNYRVDKPDAAMTVSGQIEQMRLSRCYTESKSMTCTTCHDPHSLPDAAQKVEHFRTKCLSCHQLSSCGLPIETRNAQQIDDNCVTCHMPRGPTDIPHFSFTHHRIGIHSNDRAADRITAADQLIPVVDVSHLPELERQRLLGLANDAFAGKLAGGLNDEVRDDPSYRELAKVFTHRAQQILQTIHEQGLQDPEVDIFFSRLHWRKDPEQCIEYAKRVLQSPSVSPSTRDSALHHLATSHFDQGRTNEAIFYLDQLVKNERDEISLMLLGICHERKGNLPQAVRLINEAIQASPDRADLHIYLARIYRKMGKIADSENHVHFAKILTQTVPQPQ